MVVAVAVATPRPARTVARNMGGSLPLDAEALKSVAYPHPETLRRQGARDSVCPRQRAYLFPAQPFT